MILSILLLIIGFFLLVKGADYLVEGASSLALKASISELVIGLTIVAFGTSTPEFIVNIVASAKNNPGISYGNVIGSNIMNILLILGIAGLIHPITTKKNTVWKEIPFSLLAAITVLIMCNDLILNNQSAMLSRGDGIILTLFFIIFLVYVFGLSQVEVSHSPDIKVRSGVKISLLLLGGLAGLILGGRLVVDNAVLMARTINISEKLIGLTIVSIGTSLPELITSAVAAMKGKSEIAVGNIVGSNIFNIFFILGISAIIRPLPFQSSLNFDLLILITVSFFFFITMFTGKKRVLDRWEAIILIFIYLFYIVFLVIRK